MKSVDVNSLMVPIAFEDPDLPPIEGDALQKIAAIMKRAEMEVEAKGAQNPSPLRAPDVHVSTFSPLARPQARMAPPFLLSITTDARPFPGRLRPGRAVPSARQTAESILGNVQRSIEQKAKAEESVRLPAQPARPSLC